MKVFLDTNVLVSGFATRGLCADVIRAVLAEQQLLTASIILQELKKVLTQKIRLPKEAVQEILAFLKDYSVEAKPAPLPPVLLENEADRRVLAAALGAEADVFVTGDRELLKVAGRLPGLAITDPRGFWETIKQVPPSKT